MSLKSDLAKWDGIIRAAQEQGVFSKHTQRSKGTCPKCGKQARLGGKDGRIILAHKVPREVYKDGRGCRGAGRVAVEMRKRSPSDG